LRHNKVNLTLASVLKRNKVTMLLKLNDISKSYGSGSAGNLRKVLDAASLEVSEGESIAILGPSGSGKTT
jgi:ABC-type lipoprotein export system ATPase subunit